MVNEEKKLEIISRMNPTFDYLSEYKGMRKDIVTKCKKCGTVKTLKAKSAIEKDKNGNFRACLICKARERGTTLRKSNEKFLNEFNAVHNTIELLDNYTTNNNYIRCRCKIDGFEWKAKPHSLLQGHGCPECSHREQNWGNKERFDNILKERFPNVTTSDEFFRTRQNMHFKCNVCNYEWTTDANTILNNKDYCGCPKCAGCGRVSEQDVINRLEEKNPRVKYISGYHGVMEQAIFQCNDCGHEWVTTTNSVLSGRGCPKCNMSHGALKVSELLSNLGVKYETEYRFEDCKDIRTLPFDFYIESKNICIEYDGEQHFSPVRFGKNNSRGTPEERFELVKRRDKIKTDYCNSNGIKLIRIPYTDFNNIEEILNKYIA